MYDDDLSHEVVLSIQRILNVQHTDGSSEKYLNAVDRFDGLYERFDIVEILNDFFPDEAALAHLDQVNARLLETQVELQKQVDELRVELRVSQDPEKMSVIQEMISDLLGQMSRIREKATESEAVVRDITKDIQVLDLAKKNLSMTMTVLRKLQMLLNALSELEQLMRERKYAQVAQTLSAIKEISTSFQSYTSVPRISRVWKRIIEIQNQLKIQLDADFDAFYLQDPTNTPKSTLISQACLVIDILGPPTRLHTIDRYISLEIKEYRRVFRTHDEAGQLDNLPRRFAWFRRLLTTFETETGRVFPPEWRVGWYLVAKFCEITRDDVVTLLTRVGSGGLTLKVLLDALQVTLEWEGSIGKKWATPLKDMLKATDNPASEPGKPISAAFEPHMGIFVDAQDKVLTEMLAPHRKSATNKLTKGPTNPLAQPTDTNTTSGGAGNPMSIATSNSTSTIAGAAASTSGAGGIGGGAQQTDSTPPMVVFPSSTDLFLFYAQILEQCAKLSTGQPLFDLVVLMKKWLRIYAEEVLSVNNGMNKRPNARKSTETRVDVDLIKQLCFLINTADYCQTTALELEEKVKEKINPEFKEKITFQVECDLFVSSISSAISSLLHQFETSIDPSFISLSRTSWSSTSLQVSGPSPYTSDLTKSADQIVDIIKPLIEQKKYLRNFFDKAASVVLVRFTNSLVRSRPLREVGAEQLLIDMQSVKAFLGRMPGEALTSSSYTRTLTKTTMRLEALLKVIVTPVDPPEGFILNYTLLIGDASFTNFQKILDLKGTPKSTQNNLLDSFLTITSTKTDLESTSFLSSLDMDPPATGHAGGSLVSPGVSRGPFGPFGGGGDGGGGGGGLFAALTGGGAGGPGQSGPSTGSSGEGGAGGGGGSTGADGQKREVFSDFRRFVSFGLRKDSVGPS